MNLWPHQATALREILAAIEGGERAICVTSPTGGGKTLMMTELLHHANREHQRSVLYTNRRMLLDQTSDRLDEAGIPHGMRASGFKPNDWIPCQLSSIQTEVSRVYKRKTWKLADADMAIVDEAHQNSAEYAERIAKDHIAAGGAVLGFTATPVGLAHVFTKLIVAGTNSELRECGAHVPCHTFAPDEPDPKSLPPDKPEGEDLSESENRVAMMRPGLFGRVLTHWQRLNPDGKPTILFGPGVQQSMWFAEQFRAAGISAAHIDGDNVSLGEVDADGNSVVYKSDSAMRRQIMDASKAGEIKVLCNRFVLREGIDAPWLAHCIFATVFGALSSYLQAGGRLLRSYPGLEHVTLQDHGGNWWRHGSLNSDREWDLTYTNHIHAGLRSTSLREKKQREPITCPACNRVRLGGACTCGHKASVKSRHVVQTDGTLREMQGDIFKPRRIRCEPDTEQLWARMYHRAKSTKWNATFAQAEAYFALENGYYPPRTLRLMPTSDVDWFRKVTKVPLDRLRSPADSQRSFA